MRTLKFKSRPTNAFFAAVNQIFGGSSQLSTTTAEHCFVVWIVLSNDLITARSALVGSWEEPLNILAVARNAFVGWALNFRVRMFLKCAVKVKFIVYILRVLIANFNSRNFSISSHVLGNHAVLSIPRWPDEPCRNNPRRLLWSWRPAPHMRPRDLASATHSWVWDTRWLWNERHWSACRLVEGLPLNKTKKAVL